MAPRIPKQSLETTEIDRPSPLSAKEETPPTRLRLGCAPLLTGICLVALLGKFLPHEPKRASAVPTAPTEPRKLQTEAKPAPAAEPRPTKPAPQKTADAPRKPEVSAKPTPPVRPAKPTAAETADRAIVSNSPWNGSVRQVERYLKNSLHDAASFEAIEWSPVVETKKGFQVRCKFRSKNVLGIYVTQSKTFLLDKSGEVYAVKE